MQTIKMYNKHNNLATSRTLSPWGVSTKTAYLGCINEQLRNALNDHKRLGIIYKKNINHLLAKYGSTQ